MNPNKVKHIVLAGNPNSGKTTLFNALTGLHQKISNLPGTTIEKKTGYFNIDDHKISITDLPGTYSIHPKGEDELISVGFLIDPKDTPIDLVVFVADAGNLSRNLLLYSQVADLGYPMLLALNMNDLASKKGISNGVAELSKALAARVSSITYGVQANSLEARSTKTSVGDFNATTVIVATDATTATQLLGLPEVPRMAGCITWYHAVASNPSGNGRLIVDGQNRGPIINSMVMSDISSSYAPLGQHLVSTTTELGATESDVRRHLAIMWGTSTHDWQLIAKYEIPAALPIQNVGRALTQNIKVSDNVFVVGDHRTVPSQQGALFSGRMAAELILNQS